MMNPIYTFTLGFLNSPEKKDYWKEKRQLNFTFKILGPLTLKTHINCLTNIFSFWMKLFIQTKMNDDFTHCYKISILLGKKFKKIKKKYLKNSRFEKSKIWKTKYLKNLKKRKIKGLKTSFFWQKAGFCSSV